MIKETSCGHDFSEISKHKLYMYALQPLDISEYSGPGVGYNIYFKKETDPKDFFHVSDLLVRLYILFKRTLSVWVFLS